MPTMFDRDKLHVDVTLYEGDLMISGQDLKGFLDSDEYEYFITIPASEFPALREALGAGASSDVVELMVAHGEQIVAHGEQKWLNEHGIANRISTYF